MRNSSSSLRTREAVDTVELEPKNLLTPSDTLDTFVVVALGRAHCCLIGADKALLPRRKLFILGLDD